MGQQEQRSGLTFLFTDIEGSTRRWQEDQQAMANALAAHDELMSMVIAAHGGTIFKHTGDGVCAVFPSAPPALAAAIEAQDRLELPVRMGLHTGDAEQRDGDYFGPTLNRVARIADAGHGGQILVSVATTALVDDVELADLGVYRLRGLAHPEHIVQVGRNPYPPLRTASAGRGNLPARSSSFVGREMAVIGVAGAIEDHRLVTLTGVGGVGKTTVAIETARTVAHRFPDGVWLADLAPVADPDAVVDVLAAAVGAIAPPGLSVVDGLVEALAGRQVLLVVDGCEHLLDPVADMVTAVLAGCPEAVVLATSREALGIDAEQIWPLPPMEIEPEAAALFAERARAVRPDFELDETVVEICRRLDGIPLAIELAAARVRSLGPAEILTRLDERFRILTGGRRHRLERHRTLRRAITWSYDLLDAVEQRALRELSVFAGGFTIAAAEQVCSGTDVLDTVDSLVAKSLLVAEMCGSQTRYRMLETIRQFGEELLEESGAHDDVRQRHARQVAGALGAAGAAFNGPAHSDALRAFESQLDDLRTAFRWAVDAGDLELGLELTGRLEVLPLFTHRMEVWRWARELLTLNGAAEHPLMGSVHVAAAFDAVWSRGDLQAAAQFGRRAALMSEDRRTRALGRLVAASAALFDGRFDDVLALSRSAPEPVPDELALAFRAMEAYGLIGRGDLADGTAAAEAAVHEAEAAGSPWVLLALQARGRAALEAGDVQGALTAQHEGFRLARASGARLWEVLLGRETAATMALHGRIDDALDTFADLLDRWDEVGDAVNRSITLSYLVGLFERAGAAESAATLFGAVGRGTVVMSVTSADADRLAATVERVFHRLGASRFEELARAGAELSHRQAVDFARAGIETLLAAPAAP